MRKICVKPTYSLNIRGGKFVQYGVCNRCGTTVKLNNSSTGPSGNFLKGKCPKCGNQVVKEKPKK